MLRTTALSILALSLFQAQQLQLTRVASYGWSDLSDANRSLSDAEINSGAAVLGRIQAVAEAPDGTVYVLDGLANKVVAFSQDGSFKRVFGRTGAGPGEFRQATKLALTPAGAVLVFDPALRRLSEFRASGDFVRAIEIPDALVTDITVSDSVIWVARVVISARTPFARAYRLRDGVAVDSLLGLSQAEFDVSSGGNPGRVIGDGRGGVLFVGPLPVAWRVVRDGEVRLTGSSIFKDAGLLIERTSNGVVRLSTAAVRGAALAGSDLIVSYAHLIKRPTANSGPLESHWIGVWTLDGKERGRLDVTDSKLRVIASARNGDVFCVGDIDFPQVLRMRIRRR